MRVVVTGVAGFIGSTLADALIARGDEVVGVDCFTPTYSVALKQANVNPAVKLIEADLRDADLESILAGADVVFHQAAQPGVRPSWDRFEDYMSHNVLATQRLLEAAVAVGVGVGGQAPRVVFASSSSVYGRARSYPTTEDELPQPHSPYGVTKLAAEQLCAVYAANWGLSTVALRYFTVYGPRQRPDMAIHRLLVAGLAGRPFPVYGDGRAVRDFTFVDDVVAANLAAAGADVPSGTLVNLAGGGGISMAELIDLAGEVIGSPIRVERRAPQAGDVDRTGGSIDRARRLLGWSPKVGLEEGLRRQLEWQRSLLTVGTPQRGNRR